MVVGNAVFEAMGTAGVFQMSPEDHNGLGKGSFVMIEIVDGDWAQAQ